MSTGQSSLSEAASLEFPVMLHFGSSPAMGIVEQVNARECRVRALVDIPVGAPVTFAVNVRGAQVQLRATVAHARANLPRRYFTLTLDPLPPADADTLARSIETLAARRSAAPTLPESGGLARATVRVPVDFAVEYVADDGTGGRGRAGDLSVGGMLMVCDPLLPVGGTLTIAFALPASPGNPSREGSVKARIVAHQRTSAGQWSNNLAFFGIDAALHAELARFIEEQAIPNA